jgi:hypothetical protein
MKVVPAAQRCAPSGAPAVNYMLRAALAGLACVLLPGLASHADAGNGGAAAVIYDVDFGSPDHQVGSPPVLGTAGDPRTMPTAIWGTPVLVVDAYGDLTDQPMAFPGPKRADVQFSLEGLAACPDYRLSMKVVVDGELRILVNTPFVNLVHFQPNGNILVGIRDLATNTQTSTVVATYQPGDGVAHDLTVSLDLVGDRFEMEFDGQTVHVADFGGQVLLTAFRLLGASAAVDDVLLATGSEEADIVADIEADIDVRPESSNAAPVNLKSKGVLPVALWGADDLEAADVDTDTLTLSDSEGGEGVAPLRTSLADLDGDGLADLVMHFSMRELVAAGVLSASTASLTLSGATLAGTPLSGSDGVRVLVKRAKCCGKSR